MVVCKVRVSELLVLPNTSGCSGLFWVGPREFFSQRVGCFVLPCSCVFCLLGFSVCCSCAFVLYVLVLLAVFWRKLCQFCGSAVLDLLLCGFSGSSWLVSLETISTWYVLGGTLSVAFSNRSATCFGRYFDENFANLVEVLCWVCCSVGFRVQVGWLHCKQYPLGVFWVRLCRSYNQILRSLGNFAK